MIVARTLRLEGPRDIEVLKVRLGLAELPRLRPGQTVSLLTGLAQPAAFPVLAQGQGAAVAWPHDVPDGLLPQAARPRTLDLGGTTWVLGERTLVLGIVNVTPDSFSDGGAHATVEAAVAHGLRLLDEGADWLDVGGESTRPGASPVPVETELARVLPVIERLRERAPSVPLSVDTQKPEVARAALEAGASLVNDVSGFSHPDMPAVVAEAGAAACVMHMQGTPRTMQQAPRYDDVVHEVVEALETALQRGAAAGLPRWRLLVDPGIGFGKTLEHNLSLLRHLDALRGLGAAGVLLGTSRKTFLGALTGQTEPARRLIGSVVTAALAAERGDAQVVRVHDVRQTREALAVADALRRGSATRQD